MERSVKTTVRRAILTLMCALALALAVPAVAPAGNGFAVIAQAATKVKISKTKLSLAVGMKTVLKMKGTSKKVKWSSTNKKVATVSAKGVVKAKKVGTAKIKAKVGGKVYTCKVYVKANKWEGGFSTNIGNYDYGEIYFIPVKMQYKANGDLFVNVKVVNRTGRTVTAMNPYSLTVYCGNAAITKKFALNPIYVGLSHNYVSDYSFAVKSEHVKKVIDLTSKANNAKAKRIYLSCEYK